MNFQQLKFVREAIRHDLNLTAAANALFTSQSGVSKQIRELELELGIEIFVRKGKRLIGLTKAGEGAVTMIARVLLEAENLKRYAEQFTDEDRGRLVIATTHNQARYTLPRIAQRFAEEYPDVQLELRQGTPTYAAQAVLSGAADIAIATEALDAYPDLVTYPCFSWNHVAVVRGDHPLAKIARPTLEDIAQHSIITYNPEFSGRAQIDAVFAAQGLQPDIRLTAMDADVIKTYVELGIGVGIIAEMAMTTDQCGQLITLPFSHQLFAPNITKIALQRRVLLRGYAYKFMEMFAPHLEGVDITKAAAPFSNPASGNANAKILSDIPAFSARAHRPSELSAPLKFASSAP
ncbi:MAG: CysB family HTH-type transcriptional regulator [Caulobacterales bacterium]